MTGNDTARTLHDITTLRQRYPGAFGRTSAARIAHSLCWMAGLAAIAGAMWQTGLGDILRILSGLGKIGHLLHFMLPPAHHGWLGTFGYAVAARGTSWAWGTRHTACPAVLLSALRSLRSREEGL